MTPAGGSVFPALGYNPIDCFAYVGFIRQAAETGGWLLLNPYTTSPQDGRYFLPLFSLLGMLCRWTGLDPFWALELVRVPLIFIFFAVLWRFLATFIPGQRRRLFAVCLVAFSGGLEFIAVATLNAWPPRLRDLIVEAISNDQGWSTFAALNNPLWIAGLTLSLLALRPVLKPAGTQRLRDWCQLTIALTAAYWVHPYSGLVVLAVAALLPVARWLFGVPNWPRAYVVGAGPALGVAVAFIGAVALWQNQDAVYRATAGKVLGDHQLSAFWYPITLGAVGLLALRGWQQWLRDSTPARFEVGAWTVIVVWMHTSPLFNGYHFVFHLHLPVCIVAATALDEWWQQFPKQNWASQVATAFVIALAFQSPLAVTWWSAQQALAYQIPGPVMAAFQRLARLPTGRVYSSPHIGTLLPAFTNHRVYVGHWFLTPDHAQKQAQFMDVMAGRLPPAVWVDLLRQDSIDYLLLPQTHPRLSWPPSARWRRPPSRSVRIS